MKYRILFIFLCIFWFIGLVISIILWATIIYWVIKGSDAMVDFEDWIDPILDDLRKKI